MKIWTIAKKEFQDLFFSPISYVFMTVFLVLSLWVFFSDFFVRNEATLRVFFGWIPVLYLVFLPAIVMGKWAEEKKAGTLEILLTLPVRDWEVVLGKFLASLLFLVMSLAFTLPLALTTSFLGDLDWGPVWGGYVGLVFLGAASMAVGLFLSSLTDSSIIAFIVTFLVLFILYITGEPLVLNYLPDFITPLFTALSLSAHFEAMARGVIDSRDVLYYLSVTGFFLYLNRLSLESRKW